MINLDYEPILWLYPNEYGLRIRDGKWIRKESNKLLPIFSFYWCRQQEIDFSENPLPGDIFYTYDTKKIFICISEGYRNRLVAIL